MRKKDGKEREPSRVVALYFLMRQSAPPPRPAAKSIRSTTGSLFLPFHTRFRSSAHQVLVPTHRAFQNAWRSFPAPAWRVVHSVNRPTPLVLDQPSSVSNHHENQLHRNKGDSRNNVYSHHTRLKVAAPRH
jgi:hypothetical protein